jgi:hypothetical protein
MRQPDGAWLHAYLAQAVEEAHALALACLAIALHRLLDVLSTVAAQGKWYAEPRPGVAFREAEAASVAGAAPAPGIDSGGCRHRTFGVRPSAVAQRNDKTQ